MTPDKDIRADIQRDEQWLDEVAETPVTPSTDAIKRRVGIALGERWLKSQSPVELPPDLAERVKRRVWAECGRLREDRRSTAAVHGSYRWARWIASAAAVAAFAFVARQAWLLERAAVPGPGRISVVERNQGKPAPVDADAVPANTVEIFLASLNVAPCEDDIALSLLEQDIRLMELTVAEPAGFAADDDMVDKLYDESDRLLTELEADLG